MRKTDADWERMPPIHRAVYEGDAAKVKALLEAGADPNRLMGVREERPLRIAAQQNSLRIAQLLLRHGADVDGESAIAGTAMEAAIRHAHVKMVKLLLDYGADPSGPTRWSAVPIYRHVEQCAFNVPCEPALKIAKLLLEYGARVTPEMLRRITGANRSRPREFIAAIVAMIGKKYPDVVMDAWCETQTPVL